MNPGTVNKLEEQLRKSRHTEVPDLQPPKEGWAAISQRLQQVGTGLAPPTEDQGGQPPNTGPGALSWPYLISVAVLAIGLLYGLLNSTGELELPVKQSQGSEAVTASLEYGDEGGVEVTKETKLPAKVLLANEESRSAEDVVASQNAVQQATKKQEEPNFLANEKLVGRLGATTQTNRPKQQKADLPESKSMVASLRDTNTSDQPVLLGPSDQQQAEALVGQSQVEAPSSLAGENPAIEAEVVTPLELEINKIASPLARFGHLPLITPPLLPEYKRNGKLKVKPELQLHGSLSGHYLTGFQNSQTFDRDVTTGGAQRFFILPTGETIPARFQRSDLNTNVRRSIRLDVGINRQTRSGFLWRASAGLYYSVNSRLRDDYEEVMSTEIREDYYARRFIIPLEAGFQFTFRKRKRFRPYLGLNLVGYLYNNSVERTTFFDGQSRQEGLVGELSSRGVSYGEFDLSLTAGFQYKLTQQLSAGLALYSHSQGYYFIESPFGLEVRYSLK